MYHLSFVEQKIGDREHRLVNDNFGIYYEVFELCDIWNDLLEGMGRGRPLSTFPK